MNRTELTRTIGERTNDITYAHICIYIYFDMCEGKEKKHITVENFPFEKIQNNVGKFSVPVYVTNINKGRMK